MCVIHLTCSPVFLMTLLSTLLHISYQVFHHPMEMWVNCSLLCCHHVTYHVIMWQVTLSFWHFTGLLSQLSNILWQVGVIMCLCTQSHDHQLIKSKDKPQYGEGAETAPDENSPRDCPIKNKTTVEWVEFIQGLEGETLVEELKGKFNILCCNNYFYFINTLLYYLQRKPHPLCWHTLPVLVSW